MIPIRMKYLTSSLAAALLLATAASSDAQVGKNMGIVYPDLATEAELAALPNMTPALAKWIVDNRPFAGMKAIDDQLKATLDSTKRIALYERMYLPINLNSLVEQEIAMIPRAGRRMIREFREYAPYRALAVWYREIDKYIDEPELGRLQQYVFVPINANSGTDADLMTIPGLAANELAAIKSGRPFANAAAFTTGVARTIDAKEAQRIARYLVFTAAQQ
jgi:DNA uptake protein ComE-like DNA-binding protein